MRGANPRGSGTTCCSGGAPPSRKEPSACADPDHIQFSEPGQSKRQQDRHGSPGFGLAGDLFHVRGFSFQPLRQWVDGRGGAESGLE